MGKRKIYTGDAACLYRKCRPVERFDARLGALLDDLAETMYAAEGVGLAAPQVGILRRAVVIDCAVMHETDHWDGLVYKRRVTEPPEGYSEDAEEDE